MHVGSVLDRHKVAARYLDHRSHKPQHQQDDNSKSLEDKPNKASILKLINHAAAFKKPNDYDDDENFTAVIPKTIISKYVSKSNQ